jgi:hypothetical protein
MKTLKRIFFALLVLAAAMTSAQQAPKAQTSISSRVLSVAGRASDDGTIVLRNSDGKVWKVSNPEALKGHEGLPVVVQGQVAADKSNELHVLSVRAGKSEVEYMTKWDDSAFRR